jgi:hypothetical protein
MNVDEVSFNVFADSIKRTRWLLLVTTLLSCLLLIHMYLYAEHTKKWILSSVAHRACRRSIDTRTSPES